MRTIVLIDRDMVHVAKAETRFAQTVGYSLRRKTGPVFNPTEALFLGSGYKIAIFN